MSSPDAPDYYVPPRYDDHSSGRVEPEDEVYDLAALPPEQEDLEESELSIALDPQQLAAQEAALDRYLARHRDKPEVGS